MWRTYDSITQLNMKKTHTIILGALVLGAMVAGSTAYAFGPQNFNSEAFSSFTKAEQRALEQAFEIRKEAEEKAQKLLDDAGIEEKEIHEAMRAYMQAHRTEMETAIKNNDYDAFIQLHEGNDMFGNITREQFDVLVQANQLRNEGKFTEAEQLMESAGIKKPMHAGGKHMRMHPGTAAVAQ